MTGGASVSRGLPTDPLKDALEKAMEVDQYNVQKCARHLVAGFSVTKEITAITANGDQLRNTKPVTVVPQSYFGEVVPVTEDQKQNGYKQFDYAVKTVTDDWYPLAPHERVYNLSDGQLVFTAPALRGRASLPLLP